MPVRRNPRKADNRVENWEKPVDPPILSFLFNRFVYGFPGLRDAKRQAIFPRGFPRLLTP